MLAMFPVWPANGDELGPILITAPRMERDLLDVPAAVERVDVREIRQGNSGLTLDEPLRGVPGLFVQNRYNFAQGLRISTRGFGARAPFGIRGIRIRVDGFPETLPDGQSQTDAIDLDSAERIEVIRGPAAVAYGNAAGGVIDITTADGRDTVHAPVLSADIGGNGLRRAAIRHGGSDGVRAHHASASALRFDGHRDHSRADVRRFNAKLTRSLDRERELQAVLTVLDNPFSEDPGGLTAQELAQDRTAAVAAAEALDAGQTAEQQRLGLRWRDADLAGGELTLRGFVARRDFEQQLPFAGNSLLGFERRPYARRRPPARLGRRRRSRPPDRRSLPVLGRRWRRRRVANRRRAPAGHCRRRVRAGRSRPDRAPRPQCRPAVRPCALHDRRSPDGRR